MVDERLRILYYYMLDVPKYRWHKRDLSAAAIEELMIERLGKVTIARCIYP